MSPHSPRRAGHPYGGLPWVAAVLTVIALTAIWAWSNAALHRDADNRARAAVAEARTVIDSELRRYTDLLSAGTALFAAGEVVTVKEFANFVASFDLPHRYPGALALMTVDQVGGAYRIGHAAPTAVLEYPPGTDLSRVPHVLTTLRVAVTANAVALSAPAAGRRPGSTALFAFTPTPQGRLIGVQIDGQRFLDGVSERAGVMDEVRIADVTGGRFVPIASAVPTGERPRRTVELPTFGRRWQIAYVPGEDLLSDRERMQLWVLFGVGVAAAGLVTLTLLLQARARRRAVAMADRLAESEARRDRLLDASPVAIIEVTREGTVANENAAAARLLGHPPGSAIGQPCAITVRGADGGQTLLDLGGQLNGTPLVIDTPGGTRWVVAYHTETEPGWARLLLLVDESERHRLEERLTQAQKMEALGLLAGRIAHDFNNLLTPIGGYLDLVLSDDEGLRDDDRSMLTECRTATERAAALVGQILTIARQHVGTVRAVDAAAAVRALAGLLDQVVGADITLRVLVTAAPLAPVVAIDRTSLEQIVVNLVANARDATPPGGEVTVAVEVDGPQVVLRVRDTGVGMDESTRQRIFEPFYTTKQGSGGTGLGLATVYALVTGAGGTVEVFSAPGHGTTFEIRLARAEPPADQQPDLPGGSVSRAVPSAAGAHTVLLVEDEPPVRQLVQRILERQGYRVLVAGSAEEAQRIYADRPDAIDLLLSDVRLPGISGPELASVLTAQRAGLPVIYISGYTEGLVADDGSLPAGTRLLPKPFRAEDLTRHVAEALAHGR